MIIATEVDYIEHHTRDNVGLEEAIQVYSGDELYATYFKNRRLLGGPVLEFNERWDVLLDELETNWNRRLTPTGYAYTRKR